MEQASRVRLAAISDIHYHKNSQGLLSEVFEQAAEAADVLLLCGDLTDYGLPEEAEVLAKDLKAHVNIPIIGVLGNHDYQSDQAEDVVDILTDSGIKMLDGDCIVVHDIGFAGVRGFGGGFGRWALSAWGEKTIKDFVQEAVDEALKLERALARLDTDKRVVLLHYAPIEDTVRGEPETIFPFLGSSRLEEPLNRYKVDMAFHGHAHHGGAEGRTTADVPVYNVSIPVLRREYPDKPTFRLIEI